MSKATSNSYQLSSRCAICYQDMDKFVTAKVTKCNHFFHGECLRKWLYVQDSCPLCYSSLYEDKDKKEAKDNSVVNQAQDMAQNDAQEGLIDHDHAMERPIDDSDENNSSDSSDDNSSDSSSVRNSEDINELAEDTDISEIENESLGNEEGSWSSSDEDDLHYDSMEDCQKSINSEKTYSSSNSRTVDISDKCTEKSSEDVMSGASRIFIKSSHMNNLNDNNDPTIKADELQNNHIPILSPKFHKDNEKKIDNENS